MFHFITLFAVAPEAGDEFVRRLSTGGAWLEQARCAAPALVAADLLRHQHRPMSCATTSGRHPTPMRVPAATVPSGSFSTPENRWQTILSSLGP